MPFVWLPTEDPTRGREIRSYIERNTIALLSKFSRQAIDPASKEWLGHASQRLRVRESGLWNQNHVEQVHDSSFVSVFADLVGALK